MIKTGILGASETANIYADILKDSDKFELTGCFSPDYSNSKKFASQFNLVAYPTADALFNYADALIITDFTPDFLSNTEKAIKSFKHILITNPFLAGFEEIQYLRKLSEESGVLMQIAGGFKLITLLTAIDSKNYFFADLKHSFKNDSLHTGGKFMEYLLNDISLLLILLKGSSKKTSTSSWDVNGRNAGLMSARIELDNGCVGNLLLNQLEDCDNIILNIYGSDGVSKYEFCYPGNCLEAIRHELCHFEKSIRNNYLTSVHNDVMFHALELTHSIKAKTIRNFVVDYR